MVRAEEVGMEFCEIEVLEGFASSDLRRGAVVCMVYE
jgi:hypothetical protein